MNFNRDEIAKFNARQEILCFLGFFFLVNEYIISERPFTFDLNHVLNSYQPISARVLDKMILI